MQLTTFSIAKALGDLIAPSAVFDPTKVFAGIATAIQDEGLNTLLPNITAAGGSLAPLQEVTTWGPVYSAKTGQEVVDAKVLTFSPTTSADAAVIVGWYLMDAASGGNLLGFGTLPVPAALLGPQSILSIVLRLSLDPTGTWDVSISWDD